MKKTIGKETTFCDNCGKEAYVSKCMKCGKEHCYECKPKIGRDYTHSCWCSGSGDGYYCNDCDAELRNTKSDELHSAYLTIANLKKENENFYKEWEQRSKMAEIKVERLTRERRESL